MIAEGKNNESARDVVRVFIASPGDLKAERAAFRKLIDDLNKGFGDGIRLKFQALCWEDVPPFMNERAQSEINKLVDQCDVFILALHSHWGQDAPDAKPHSSYTEEEYYRAYQRWDTTKSPQIMVFFKDVDSRHKNDPGPQLEKVIEFRKRLEATKKILPHSFSTPKQFKDKIDDCLRSYARQKLGGTSTSISGIPNERSVNEDQPHQDAISEPVAIGDLFRVTHESTAREIDKVLAGNATLSGFLKRASPVAIEKSGDKWVVSKIYREQQGDVCDVLKGIKGELGSVASTDLSDLLTVVSGFITLAIDPLWIGNQEPFSGTKFLYPSKRRKITFKDQMTADLVPVFASALARGLPQLNRVFENQSRNPHELADGPKVLKSVNGADKEIELIKHLMTVLLSPDSRPENPNASKIKSYLPTVKSLIKAAKEDGDPYFSLNEDYLAFADVFHGTNLKLHELLLISTSDEVEPVNLVSKHIDPVFLFRYAFEIYQYVSRKLPIQ